MAKYHWKELYTQYSFLLLLFQICFAFFSHFYSSRLFSLLIRPCIYLLELWLDNVNIVKDRKSILLSLFGFG